MRKAAGGLGKRGSRRKGQQQDVADSSSHSESNHPKRKQTPEEAALTAKNYRLAKELSELRVRHRDETKNVTRLTMENMNLASRCREAISHVSLLKKELAMHQKKAAEALALQRQQSNRSASNVSENGSSGPAEDAELSKVPSSKSVAAEMERMDRLLAAHAPPPPPGHSQEEDVVSPHSEGEFFADFSASTTSSPEARESALSPSNESTGSGQTGISGMSSEMSATAGIGSSRPMDDRLPGSALFPNSSSPHVTRKHNYNDTFPADITPASIHHERRMPAVEDIDEQQENEADSVSVVSHSREEANKKISSMDAFEASFVTPFPDSFNNPSPTSVGQKEKEASSEIYNPFFSSPAKPGKSSRLGAEREETAGRASKSDHESSASRPVRERSAVSKNVHEGSSVSKNVRGRSPVTSRRLESSRGTNNGTEQSNDKGPGPRAPSPSSSPALSSILDKQRQKIEEDERNRSSNSDAQEPASSPSLDGRGKGAEQYHTPPQSSLKSPEGDFHQPRRPAKTVSSSARARYERALHPRGEFGGRPRTSRDPDSENESVSSSTGGDTEEVSKVTSHSPSMVLKRLQQRRERERGGTSDEASMNSQTSGTSVQSYRRSQAGQLGTIGSSPMAEARRKFGSGSRPHRPTPAERDMHSLPSDEEDGVSRTDRSERSMYSQNGRALGSTRRAGSETLPARHSPTPSPLPDKMSSEAMDAESRALDAMATGTMPAVDGSPGSKSAAAARYMESIKQRRTTTKQPVSYTEPSLSSKLRRGDVYFPKTSPGMQGGRGSSARNHEKVRPAAKTPTEC